LERGRADIFPPPPSCRPAAGGGGVAAGGRPLPPATSSDRSPPSPSISSPPACGGTARRAPEGLGGPRDRSRAAGGLVTGVMAPRSSRAAGLAAVAFALVRTLVRILTIAIGPGPQSSFDKALHLGFL